MQRRSLRNEVGSMVVMCFLLMIGVGCASSTCSSSSNLTLFSQQEGHYDGPAWSPDGHWLASESTDTTQLSLFSTRGQLVNQLRLGCDLGTGVGDFSWVTAGRISCFIGNEPPLLTIVELDQRGQVKKSVTITVPLNSGTVVYAMQWNPDHAWLATIAESTPGAATSATLYLSDLEGHRLSSPMPVDAQGVAWSPDGTRLALVKQNGEVVLLKVQETSVGKLPITKPQTLTAGTMTGEGLEWSPSGRWLVCHHASYQSEDYLFLRATDGSGKQVKLTSSTTDRQLDFPAWLPDGKQLVVSRVSDNVLLSLDIASLLKDKGVEP